MAINAGSTPVLWQKIVGCCWLNVDADQFKEVTPGVFQWNPGFDAGECVFRWFDTVIGDTADGSDTALATGLTVVKSADVSDLSDAQPGDVINYSFVVTNTGSVVLSNVQVTDPVVTVSGGPIVLPVGGSDSVTFTASYIITQADIDAGQVVNVASVSAVDPDGVGIECPSNEVVVSVSDAPVNNLAVGLDAAEFRSSSEGSAFDLSGFTCLDGTPIDEWRVSFDGGLTYISGVDPASVNGDPGWDCADWQFRCDDDWSDAAVTFDIAVADNTYVDSTFNIDEGINGFFTICNPCGSNSQLWEFRIDDAEADDDHALTPNVVTGDRPNSDPGNPTPDDAWQRAAFANQCHDCVTFNVDEVWPNNPNTVIRPDGVDPDDHLGEFFVFYLRTSCDGGASWLPEIKITLQS